jgi:glycosyltransferase involved in cell wall biosynthesis
MVFLFSLFCLILILAISVELARGYKSLGRLADTKGWEELPGPLVSIIVPACNEEDSIEDGLRSLCCQRYPNLEILVVNDRSTDSTGQVIDKVRRDYPSVKVLTVTTLPAGWLGKPHAMQTGARAARGDYLLFTDADVCLEETVISRSVRAMQEGGLDHLALIFSNSGGSLLLNTLINDVGAGLLFLVKPWKAKDPGSRFFVGVGAFNMVRSSAYREFGGHESLRMQVIDDVFLGKRIKQYGFRQDCLMAQDFVTLPWYKTVAQMVSGLMKNVYGFFHYRAWMALAAVTGIIAVVILPVWFIFLSTGIARYLFLLAVMIRIIGVGAGMARTGVPVIAALYLFLTPYICIYIILRAVWLAHHSGGITWRDTFYPLAELRQGEWLFGGIVNLSRKSRYFW